MDEKGFDKEKIIRYWIDSAEEDYDTMLTLYENNKNSWALFVGHLVIEKLLKGKVVKVINDHAPLTHDLRRLAKQSGMDFENKHGEWLDTITTFNISARYDSYKHSFYKRSTPAFTAEWVEKIKELREWIKKRL